MRHSLALWIAGLLLVTFPAWAADPVGLVAVVKGDVLRVTEDGGKHPLFAQDKVYETDTIITGKRARVQLILNDDSVYTIGRDSTVKIDTFVYDAETHVGRSAVNATQGVLQFVTGKIAKQNHQNVKVMTPFATVGVRGSGGVIQVAENGATLVGLTQCCLDVSANGANATPVPLDNVNDFSQVNSPDQPATPAAPMTPQIRQQLAAALGGALDGEGDAEADAPADEGATEPAAEDGAEDGADKAAEPEEPAAEDAAEPENTQEESGAGNTQAKQQKAVVAQRRQAVIAQQKAEAKQQVVPALRAEAVAVVEEQPATAATSVETVVTPAEQPSYNNLDNTASVPLTTLDTTTQVTTLVDTTTNIVNVNEVASEDTAANNKGQLIGGRLDLSNDGRGYAMILGYRDENGTEEGYNITKASRTFRTYSDLPDTSTYTNVRTVPDTNVPAPTQAFSAGFVEKGGTGTFYRVRGATAANPNTVVTQTDENGMITGMRLLYGAGSLDGTDDGYVPDRIRVSGGSMGGADDASTLDNRSYAMGADRIAYTMRDGDSVEDYVATNEKVASGIVSDVALLKLCDTCAFTHWGVWAGNFERLDIAGTTAPRDMAHLVPYVAGEKTTEARMTSLADTRVVDYQGHTFGALVNNNGISHHVGDFSLQGTLGRGLDMNANLADYKMNATINSANAGFNSALDVTHGNTTYSGAGSTVGAFFGNQAQEVGGQFEFNVDGTSGAGIYQGADTNAP